MRDWLPQLTEIDDPVADDFWSYETEEGIQRVVRVTIGRPAPIPKEANGDWYCPLRIEGRTPGLLCAVGVGPVDALANAARAVTDHFEELRKVSPRARAFVKQEAVKSVQVRESELQDVFNQWGTGRAGVLIAGAPQWLLKRGQPLPSRSFDSEHAVSVRPDVVWDEPDSTYLLELKSAAKYEPLVLAQAFAEAFLLGQNLQTFGLGHKPTPAILTRFNQWNRAALSHLLEQGFVWGREFYLEFDVVQQGQRRWLWVDAPLAPLTPVARPPARADALTALRHWYQIGSCKAWFGTEQELSPRNGLLLRPVIPSARYAVCAAVEGSAREWLLWSGLPGTAGEFWRLEEASETPA